MSPFQPFLPAHCLDNYLLPCQSLLVTAAAGGTRGRGSSAVQAMTQGRRHPHGTHLWHVAFQPLPLCPYDSVVASSRALMKHKSDPLNRDSTRALPASRGINGPVHYFRGTMDTFQKKNNLIAGLLPGRKVIKVDGLGIVTSLMDWRAVPMKAIYVLNGNCASKYCTVYRRLSQGKTISHM